MVIINLETTTKIRKPIMCKKVFYQRNVDLGLDGECHECISHRPKDKNGYIACNRDGFKRMHRWIYWMNTGESPEVVMHCCDNRKCININHLKAGTSKENSFDCTIKGRNVGLIKRGQHLSKNTEFKKGYIPKNTKLNKAKVITIKYCLSKGLKVKELSKIFKVSESAIYAIKFNRNWKEVV